MENWGELNDEFFDAWEDNLYSLRNDVQTRLSTMIREAIVLSRDAILIFADLCHNIIRDLVFLESRVGLDFPWRDRLEYLKEILFDVVVDILTILEVMFDSVYAKEKKMIHSDNM